MSPSLAAWNTKRPVRLGVGVAVGGCGLGGLVASGVAVGALCVGGLVGAGVPVASGVEVAELVNVGDCWALVGKGMTVGSGGTAWLQAATRIAMTTTQDSRVAGLTLFTDHHLFVAQSIDRVET
jgi:hypothetical protein